MPLLANVFLIRYCKKNNNQLTPSGKNTTDYFMVETSKKNNH